MFLNVVCCNKQTVALKRLTIVVVHRCPHEVPAINDESFRLTPWIFETTAKQENLKLIMTKMGGSMIYNPVAKAKKRKSAGAKHVAKKRRGESGVVSICGALPPLSEQNLQHEKARMWLDDAALAICGVFEGIQHVPEAVCLQVKSLLASLCLEFCFQGKVQVGEKTYTCWNKLRDEIRALARSVVERAEVAAFKCDLEGPAATEVDEALASLGAGSGDAPDKELSSTAKRFLQAVHAKPAKKTEAGAAVADDDDSTVREVQFNLLEQMLSMHYPALKSFIVEGQPPPRPCADALMHTTYAQSCLSQS
jgi:hypothetical protein